MLIVAILLLQPPSAGPEIVSFQNEHLALRGVFYKPEGPGPFPALLYNHGSAPGMLNGEAFEQLGPLFAQRGWIFFAPYRRGQGLSAAAGPFIGAEIAAARNRAMGMALLVAIPALLLALAVARRGQHRFRMVLPAAVGLVALLLVPFRGARAGTAAMVRLLETDHLSDQLAALRWLRSQGLVDQDRIAAGGNSFGGIETVLGAARVGYCAAIDASGGAESWGSAPQLRDLMVRAVRSSRAPIFFFQAANDYDTSPSRTLSTAMNEAGKESGLKIYPASGSSASDGHRFAWSGSAVWADDVFHFLDAHCPKREGVDSAR